MYKTEDLFLKINASLAQGTVPEPEDFFAQVYENSLLRYTMVALYLAGLLPCMSLIFVVWYERSGLAGNYRTILNQLSSTFLLYVSHFFVDCA